MKTNRLSVFNTRLLALLFLFCSLTAWVNGQDNFKKKEITKSFSASKNDLLQVDNRFGTITITHGSKNQVDFRVVIETKSRSEAQLKRLIDRISINMQKNGNTISAVTTLKSDNSNGGGDSFSINYFISMPSNLTCDLKQKYGSINMPEDNPGKCMLESKYGNINGGNFSGPLEIEVQYGNMTIGNVHKADLDFAYAGKAILQNATELEIESKYSNIEMGTVQKLEIETKYGNLKAESLNNTRLGMKYGKCQIGEVKQSLIVDELGYSTLDIRELSSKFERVDVNAHYGNLNISIASNASFRLAATSMKYGNCSVKGFNVNRRTQSVNSEGFDSRSSKNEQNDFYLDINNGKGGLINFEGNNYSNIKVTTL